MKSAKDILYEHATNNSDGFMAGQVSWIVQAMEEYAMQHRKLGIEEGISANIQYYEVGEIVKVNNGNP